MIAKESLYKKATLKHKHKKGDDKDKGKICFAYFAGTHGRNRTYDLKLRRLLLYPLSYVGV